MYSKEKLLEMLSSEKASTRYDACEWLRVSQESSPEIVIALEKATHDDDKEIAERAAYALQADIHHQMAIKMGIVEPDYNGNEDNEIMETSVVVDQTQDKEKGLAWVSIAFYLIIGIILVIIGLRHTWDAYFTHKIIKDSRTWPVTMGEVTAAEMESATPRGTTHYKPIITYVYNLKDVSYYCNVMKLSTTEEASAQAFLSSFPVGTNIQVLYNPKNPRVCVTEFDEGSDPTFPVGIAPHRNNIANLRFPKAYPQD